MAIMTRCHSVSKLSPTLMRKLSAQLQIMHAVPVAAPGLFQQAKLRLNVVPSRIWILR